MYGIFIQHKNTTDSILDAGDKELAKKRQSMLSWSLGRQKLNTSGGDKCLFQLACAG